MTAEEFKSEYLPHKFKLYRIAFYLLQNRQDAEDIVQETYVKLWSKRNDLSDILNSEAYSVTLLKHLALDHLKSKKVKGYNIDIEEIEVADDDHFGDQLEAQSSLNRIAEWLKELPPNQRLVFLLRHKEGMSIKEIAEKSNLTLSNVKVILSRVRQELKQKIESNDKR